jgi:hypothetical protein
MMVVDAAARGTDPRLNDGCGTLSVPQALCTGHIAPQLWQNVGASRIVGVIMMVAGDSVARGTDPQLKNGFAKLDSICVHWPCGLV